MDQSNGIVKWTKEPVTSALVLAIHDLAPANAPDACIGVYIGIHPPQSSKHAR
jgi:hypothetical protein